MKFIFLVILTAIPVAACAATASEKSVSAEAQRSPDSYGDHPWSVLDETWYHWTSQRARKDASSEQPQKAQ